MPWQFTSSAKTYVWQIQGLWNRKKNNQLVSFDLF